MTWEAHGDAIGRTSGAWMLIKGVHVRSNVQKTSPEDRSIMPRRGHVHQVHIHIKRIQSGGQTVAREDLHLESKSFPMIPCIPHYGWLHLADFFMQRRVPCFRGGALVFGPRHAGVVSCSFREWFR